MSFFESNNASLLFVEVKGLVHPFFKSIRDFFHEVDHGGDLDVKSFCK